MSRPDFKMKIVRSDGREFMLGDGSKWLLSMNGMEDWVELDHDVSTSANVLTDGSSLVSKRIGEKDRTLTAVYWGTDRASAREEALSFFNPKHSFAAHLTYMGRTRWCEGEQIGFDCPIVTHSTPVHITWTLLCLDPYMRGEDIHDETMQDAVGMFTFPFICLLPSRDRPSGCVSSIRVYDGKNTVYNSGGITAPFKISTRFDGPITNPTYHINDKHVKVVTSMDDRDTLVIDFMASPPTVTLNGLNIIGKCSRDSSFVGMSLEVGSNLFWYEAEDGDVNQMVTSIIHYDRYMGV